MQCELREADFWSATPRQIQRVYEGRKAAAIARHNERMHLAWHIAALPLMNQFPELAKLQIGEEDQRREQTWQEQKQIMEMWTVMLGGKIVTKDKAH